MKLILWNPFTWVTAQISVPLFHVHGTVIVDVKTLMQWE